MQAADSIVILVLYTIFKQILVNSLFQHVKTVKNIILLHINARKTKLFVPLILSSILNYKNARFAQLALLTTFLQTYVKPRQLQFAQ
jgi:hypothetical protein